MTLPFSLSTLIPAARPYSSHRRRTVCGGSENKDRKSASESLDLKSADHRRNRAFVRPILFFCSCSFTVYIIGS
ncbi:hypothetical protein ACS0TY_001446 [Phlomoides rotata]